MDLCNKLFTKLFTFPHTIDFALITRGVTALLVVFWHTRLSGTTNSLAQFIVMPGRSAVWIFFALSGYLLTYGYESKKYDFTQHKLLKFYKNRFIRIYPIFFVVSFFSLIIVHPLIMQTIGIEFLTKNFFFIQYSHDYALNGVFWTLGIEFQFYVFFPLIYYVNKSVAKIKFSPLIIYSIICAFNVLLKPWDDSLLDDSRSLLGNLTHFQIGIIACLYRENIIRFFSNYRPANFIVIFMAIIIYLISNKLYFKQTPVFFDLKGIFLIDLLSFLILSLHIQWDKIIIIKNHFIWRFFFLTGILSYGVYAWHPVLIAKIPNANVFQITILSCIVALISYFLIEKPLTNLKKSN